MKKVLALLLAVMLVIPVLAACGKKADTSENTNVTDNNDKDNNQDNQNQDQNKKKVTLSFVHWRGEDKDAFDEIISRFNEKYPHIDVEQTIYTSEQYVSTAHTLLQDGEAGDVFTSFPGAQFQTIRKGDLFDDITNQSFVSKFNEALITAGLEDGVQYAVPFQMVYNQPVYNKKAFEKAGVDFEGAMKDWDSWLDACQKLKDAGYVPIAFPGGDIGPGQFMNSMMMNLEPDEGIWARVLSGEAKITEDWWVKTLAHFNELNSKGYFNTSANSLKHQDGINMIASEEAAMLATGSYAISGILAKNPDLELGIISPNPASEGEKVWDGIHNATFLLGINKKSNHKEEAAMFIDFLTEKEIASYYANTTGQQLTLKDVEYTSKELMEIGEVWGPRKTRTQPRFFITDQDVQNAVLGSIQDVISGTEPQKAADNAQKLIDEILSR